MTQRELIVRMCALAGREPVNVSSIPSLALRIAGVVMPTLREVRRVSYQFTMPFVIDSAETTETFGLEPTPLDDTLRAMLAHYGVERGSDVQVRS